ncbi:hypothetical protein [Fructobacillus fructosus]|uniref:hypothetical protein n=1 Tax=Fructobacillus fructosus TaxID=1631 RepID=UPI002D9BA9A2|nr:unnamed protein product [Fructobacillus fructosus]CAK1251509.1 unnamed protein product [Fructobacillus fructosus]CAK1251689.1 unnamed protein product [Fructobacillus fructosus]
MQFEKLIDVKAWSKKQKVMASAGVGALLLVMVTGGVVLANTNSGTKSNDKVSKTSHSIKSVSKKKADEIKKEESKEESQDKEASSEKQANQSSQQEANQSSQQQGTSTSGNTQGQATTSQTNTTGQSQVKSAYQAPQATSRQSTNQSAPSQQAPQTQQSAPAPSAPAKTYTAVVYDYSNADIWSQGGFNSEEAAAKAGANFTNSHDNALGYDVY